MRYTVALIVTALAAGLLFFARINPSFIPLGHTEPDAPDSINTIPYPQTTGDATMPEPFSITSSVFDQQGTIPARYTCDGEQLSPPLSIVGTPSDAQSLVLIVDDPDVPKVLRPDGLFVHWVLFNIPPAVTELPEGTSIGTAGANTAGNAKYTGPCPPPQYEPKEHSYVFSLYALDTTLDLPEGASKEETLTAMQDHVIAETRLTGRYARP